MLMRAIRVIMMLFFFIMFLFMVFVTLSKQDICQLMSDKEWNAPIEGYSKGIGN